MWLMLLLALALQVEATAAIDADVAAAQTLTPVLPSQNNAAEEQSVVTYGSQVAVTPAALSSSSQMLLSVGPSSASGSKVPLPVERSLASSSQVPLPVGRSANSAAQVLPVSISRM